MGTLSAFRAEQYPKKVVILKLSEQLPGRRQDGSLQMNRLADDNPHGPLLRNTSEGLSFQKKHHDLKI